MSALNEETAVERGGPEHGIAPERELRRRIACLEVEIWRAGIAVLRWVMWPFEQRPSGPTVTTFPWRPCARAPQGPRLNPKCEDGPRWQWSWVSPFGEEVPNSNKNRNGKDPILLFLSVHH